MNNPENILSRAQTLIESQDYSKARALLMSLLPNALSSKERANRAALLVHCLHATGANQLARQTLDAELLATPEVIDLWMLSSHLYAEQNDLKGAERALQGAVRHCHAPEAGLALASFLSQEHRDMEALACYEKMLLEWPKHPDVLFERREKDLGDSLSIKP
jgi:tetratricopeptide (TPR) repeat protein